jgi:hypothetical protein
LERPANGIRVEVSDLRFGAPPHPGFVARAIVDQTGRVLESGFSYRPVPEKQLTLSSPAPREYPDESSTPTSCPRPASS